MRREWIEMSCRLLDNPQDMSPSMRREWIEMRKNKKKQVIKWRLPPCGGSGLKFLLSYTVGTTLGVSLHAEGVD